MSLGPRIYEQIYSDVFHGSRVPPEKDKGLNNPNEERDSTAYYRSIGAFFVDDELTASTYGPHVTKSTIELDNPEVFDWEGENWELGPKSVQRKGVKTTNDAAKEAFNSGHDGAIIKDIQADIGPYVNGRDSIDGYYSEKGLSYKDPQNLIIPFNKDVIKKTTSYNMGEKNPELKKYYDEKLPNY